MYARYVCRHLVGTKTEVELLIELLTSWTVLLQSSPDLFDSVRGHGRRIKVMLVKAALYICCQGSGMLLGMEGAFRVSIDCYDTAWSRHLELEISIVWHHIESSECGSSEQCMIATAEWDYIEDQFFASEIIWRSEDHFQCD